jgi:hypothetical protein
MTDQIRGDEILNLLRAANPTSASELEAALSAEQREATRERAISLAETVEDTGELRLLLLFRRDNEPKRWQPRLRRLAVMAAVGAALVALASSLLPSSSHVPGRGGSSSSEVPGVISTPLQALGTESSFASAQAALKAAAKAASKEPSPAAAAAGGYVYYKTRSAFANQDTTDRSPWWVYYSRSIEERWTAPDGSGRVYGKHLPAKFATAQDKARWRAAGSPPFGFESAHGSASRLFKPGEQSGVFTRGLLGLKPKSKPLPTDPAKLVRLFNETNVYSSRRESNTAAAFKYATIILTYAGASPKLRAAVYNVVSHVKGVQLIGRVRDPIGRVGTGVSVVSDYPKHGVKERYTLIFDTDTSRFLARTTEFADEKRNLPISYTVLLDSGRVNSIHKRP